MTVVTKTVPDAITLSLFARAAAAYVVAGVNKLESLVSSDPRVKDTVSHCLTLVVHSCLKAFSILTENNFQNVPQLPSCTPLNVHQGLLSLTTALEMVTNMSLRPSNQPLVAGNGFPEHMPLPEEVRP